MSADVIAGTEPVPGSPYLSEEQMADLLWRLAKPGKPIPHAVLAAEFNRAPQTIKNIKYQNRERVAELRALREADLDELYWIRDSDYRLELRQDAFEKCLQQQAVIAARIKKLEKHPRRDDVFIVDELKNLHDQWNKKEQLKQQMLRYVEESAGQLPTRSAPTPDHGRATYEIPGVDLGEVVKGWGQQSSEVLK